jgi:hypothetical protein
MGGVEVLDQHEGEASIGREVAQQAREGVQPAGRRTDTDDRHALSQATLDGRPGSVHNLSRLWIFHAVSV